MARKTALITIDAPGRDQGKRYVITEMPASRAEWWAIRALGAMARSGVDVPPEALDSGMMGVTAVGLRALLASPDPELKPLLDEMFECVQRKEDLGERALVEDDIEEAGTRLRLRDEVLKLHTGFSLAAALLEAVAEFMSRRAASSITPMSPPESGPSSAPA